MKFTKFQIKKRIIRKLVRRRKFGGSHTEYVLGGLSKGLRGEKIVQEVIGDLIRDGWLIKMKKTNEDHYCLNPHKPEIMEFYERYCCNQ